MFRMRHDNFISELEMLVASYSEYSDIFSPIIAELKRGKTARVQQLLQQQDNYW
jgi:hypothetical protein